MPTNAAFTQSRVEAALQRIDYERQHGDETHTAYASGEHWLFITWYSREHDPFEIDEELVIEQMEAQGVSIDAFYAHLNSL